jgi:hypothetical protein
MASRCLTGLIACCFVTDCPDTKKLAGAGGASRLASHPDWHSRWRRDRTGRGTASCCRSTTAPCRPRDRPSTPPTGLASSSTGASSGATCWNRAIALPTWRRAFAALRMRCSASAISSGRRCLMASILPSSPTRSALNWRAVRPKRGQEFAFQIVQRLARLNAGKQTAFGFTVECRIRIQYRRLFWGQCRACLVGEDWALTHDMAL